MKKLTILVIEDHALVAAAWQKILQSCQQYEVLGLTGSAEEALTFLEMNQPDIILLDISLPGMNGLDAIEKILACSPNSKIIGVSTHVQPLYAKRMLNEGGHGYITKNSSPNELFCAIQDAMQGKKYICSEIANILSDMIFLNEDSTLDDFNKITKRELQVIRFVVQGLTSKELASSMGISLKTVEVHRHNILKKLKLKNTASLINYVHTHHYQGI